MRRKFDQKWLISCVLMSCNKLNANLGDFGKNAEIPRMNLQLEIYFVLWRIED